MSTYVGDFTTGVTVRKMWNSNAVAGESITRATNGTISVYKDGGTTQSTTGVTDTEDFDGLTGVHLVAIDTSADGTFYSAGSDFEVVLSGATIDSKAINATLFSFSLLNRSALRPTTAGRTLDVSAGGEAGVDWANVGSPTTTVNLSGTTVKTATDVETDTADIQSRLPAALGANGNIKADVRDFNGTAGTFTVSGKPDVTLGNNAHGGTSATVRLGGSSSTPAFYVTNSGGSAVKFEATGSNGNGIYLVGNGTADGAHFEGGATGHGIHGSGGATSGNGARFSSSGGNSSGLVVSGLGSAAGLSVTGGDTGQAVKLIGGSTSGEGLLITTTSGLGISVASVTFSGTFTVGTNAIPWNAAWDAEVQSEVDDAIVAQRLDELLNADSDIDGAAPPTVGSVFHELMTKTTGSFTFDQTTDSLEALRDNVGTAGASIVLGSGALVNVTAWTVDITGNLSGSVASVTGAVGSVTGAVGSVAAGGITASSIATGAIDADSLAADAVAEIWGTGLTESYGTDGSPLTGAQLLYLTMAGVLEHAISGTTKTLKKLDGSTTAATFTLDSSTTPTSITRAT